MPIVLVMMKIEIEHGPDGTKLELIGKLSGPWVEELESVASRESPPLEIRTGQLQYIDLAGRYLLELLKSRGARVLLALLAIRMTLPAEPLKLTLEEAVRIALKQNPGVQVANLNRAVAEQDARIGKSALLPQVSMDLSHLVQRGSVEASIGFSLPGLPGHIGPFQVINVGPRFGMPIFDLTLLNRWKAAKQGRETSAMNELGVREQTTALVVGQYLSALRQAAAVDAAVSRRDLADALYKQAQNLQQAGVGTGLDTLRANQKLQVEKQNLIVQQTQLRVTLFGLAKLLSIEEGNSVELADAQSFFNSRQDKTEEAEVSLAWSQRPELKSLASRIKAQQLEETAAKRERLPTVRFDGTYGQQGTAYNRMIPAYQIGGTVSVPIYTGGRIGAEIAKAKIETEKLERNVVEMKNQVAYEVKTAREQYRAAQDEVDVANLGLTLARQEVEQSRDRFQAGVTNNIEVVTAQDSLARATESQIEALYRVGVARADIARAMGRMEAAFTK
ncbi:TolC family protein [Bryobacter aggregatus]|uniref:TolC family protein n=1 Tax=Bryobacter aggregatus TaxID=360054 RepID=UPI0012BA61AE|nr:TolC family protein [Bryobacter aggregatus]